MPYHVSLTDEALADLNSIYLFIEAATSHPAADWFNRLQIAIDSLSEMPYRAPIVREDLNLRHLLFGNKPHVYRVLYHVDKASQRVVVVSIRHGARAPLKPI